MDSGRCRQLFQINLNNLEARKISLHQPMKLQTANLSHLMANIPHPGYLRTLELLLFVLQSPLNHIKGVHP